MQIIATLKRWKAALSTCATAHLVRRNYVGRHHLETVEVVNPAWHPQDYWNPLSWSPARKLWALRMQPIAGYWWHKLSMPLDSFYDLIAAQERELADRLNNWRWLEHPVQEWPAAWRNDYLVRKPHGSDLPARGELLHA